MSTLRDLCEQTNAAPGPAQDFFSTVSRFRALQILVLFLLCAAWIIAMLFKGRAGDVFTEFEVILTCAAILVSTAAGMFLLFFGILRVAPHFECLIGPRPPKKQ